MQLVWVETFLRPFTIIYCIVLVYLMDMALIESRFPKIVYFIATALCVIFSSAMLLVLYHTAGLLAIQKYFICAIALPPCLLYYFLSKHRGSRFFFAFCTADMACMSMIMLSMSMSMFLGGSLTVILLTRLLLVTLMAIFIIKYVRRPFCYIINNIQTGWGTAAFLALVFYLLLYGYFLFPTAIKQRPKYMPVGILILVLLFSCYWFIYKSILWQNKVHQAEKTEQGLRLQLTLQKEQYDAIEKKIQKDQIFRHDLRHHARLLADMLYKQNVEEALNYLEKLSTYTLMTSTKIYCENLVVNAVLSSQLAVAKQQNIQVNCKVSLPANLDVDGMELCVLLSNLLENAIEHCCSDGTYVPVLDISILKNNAQICIRIRNNFYGRLYEDKNGTYFSQKPQGGIGLQSVSAIVAKHHGAMNITYTNQTFTVDVAL